MQKDLKDALFMFAVSNSCVNPLIYGSYTMNFRGHFRRWLALLSSANVRSPWSTNCSGSRSGGSNIDSLNNRKSGGGACGGRSRGSGSRGGRGSGVSGSKKNRYIHEVKNTTTDYSHISPLSVSMSLADHAGEEDEEAVVVENIITSRQIGSLSTGMSTLSHEQCSSSEGGGGKMLITTTTEAIIVQNSVPGTSYSSWGEIQYISHNPLLIKGHFHVAIQQTNKDLSGEFGERWFSAHQSLELYHHQRRLMSVLYTTSGDFPCPLRVKNVTSLQRSFSKICCSSSPASSPSFISQTLFSPVQLRKFNNGSSQDRAPRLYWWHGGDGGCHYCGCSPSSWGKIVYKSYK